MKPQALGAFMGIAWDWSELNDVPVEIWRDEAGDWRVTVKLKDSVGWFTGGFAIPDDLSIPRGDLAGVERARIHQQLSHACQRARRQRMETLAKKTRAPLTSD